MSESEIQSDLISIFSDVGGSIATAEAIHIVVYQGYGYLIHDLRRFLEMIRGIGLASNR
jgi:hypothetical protein